MSENTHQNFQGDIFKLFLLFNQQSKTPKYIQFIMKIILRLRLNLAEYIFKMTSRR